MARIQAKKIAEALKKAQRVGEVEEQFSIAGCNVVLRSLTNPEYVAVVAALEGLEDIEYAVSFRVEHLSRSICEINGESLREVDFVEVDVENPKTGRVETQVLERHHFVRDYVLASWSREALDVAARKFNDLVEKAERVASEGIRFETPDETAEEMYRRLLAEAKDIEGTVPFELAAKIRDEFGFLLKQEWNAADEKLANVVQVAEEELNQSPAPAINTRPVGPALEQPAPEPAPQPAPAPQSAPVQSTSAILRRPATPPPEAAQRVQPAPTPAPTPQTLGVPLIPPMGAPVAVNPALSKKSAEIQALEGDISGEQLGASPQTAYNPHAPTLENRPLARDPVAAAQILDQPPAGGINPRFKPRPKY